MSNYAIQVRGLGKRYRIGGNQARYRTLRETISQLATSPLKRAQAIVKGGAATETTESIWALRDISFDVNHGEVVGIIGRNGAGKTTLLKVLSRITSPTTGTADIFGRVGSLLEVGTGFHPELTGRENIYLNGAILGMRKSEIDRRFDEIASFAEVERFLDTPVKHFSSGMYVRLAFSVAAHLETEILLVDEVLSVGDAAFQERSMGKMGNLAASGRTVIFVSHNMAAISGLCSRAILLDEGCIKDEGDVTSVASQYLREFSTGASVLLDNTTIRDGSGEYRITKVQIVDSLSQDSVLRSGRPIDIILSYELRGSQAVDRAYVTLTFFDAYRRKLFSVGTKFHPATMTLKSGMRLVCHLEKLPLMPGKYSTYIWAGSPSGPADIIEDAGSVTVAGEDFFGSGLLPNVEKHGPILVHHSWSLEPGRALDDWLPSE